MTQRTADQASTLEVAPQEQRVIISCNTCNVSVATAWTTKLKETLDTLNQGKHTGHKFTTQTADELYAKGEPNPQMQASRDTYDRITAENNGILIY